MAVNTFKAGTILTQLVDLLAKECTTMPYAVMSVDTDGNPFVTLSADPTPAYSEKVCVIRVKPLSWNLQKDILGNTANQYTGHVIEICTEANSVYGTGGTGATTSASVADVMGPVEMLPILIEAGRTGCWVDWYQTTNGTVPSISSATMAGTKTAGWKNLYWNIQTAT
jgi:hypothetical protein